MARRLSRWPKGGVIRGGRGAKAVTNRQKEGDTDMTTEPRGYEYMLKDYVGAPKWREEDGAYLAYVDVPNSTEVGEEAYDEGCEAVMAELRAVLPGWVIEWAGSGNTDDDGDCTEDVYLTPPEATAATAATTPSKAEATRPEQAC